MIQRKDVKDEGKTKKTSKKAAGSTSSLYVLK